MFMDKNKQINMLSDPRNWVGQCQKELKENVVYKSLLKFELTQVTSLVSGVCVCTRIIKILSSKYPYRSCACTSPFYVLLTEILQSILKPIVGTTGRFSVSPNSHWIYFDSIYLIFLCRRKEGNVACKWRYLKNISFLLFQVICKIQKEKNEKKYHSYPMIQRSHCSPLYFLTDFCINISSPNLETC